jgi:hypothetical protein
MAGPKGSQQRFSAEALTGKNLYWLLEFTYASVTHRLSRQVIEVYDKVNDKWLQYEGGILNDIEWEEAIDLFSDSAAPVSVPLSLLLPVDVAELVAMGHDLSAAYGELSQIIEGDTYDKRRIVLRGRASDPQYGGDGEPITFSLEANTFEDKALIPAPSQVISLSTWPLAGEDSLGLAYPFVFGRQPTSGVGNVGFAPAYLIDPTPASEKVIIAGHETQAVTCTVSCDTTPAGLLLPIVYAADGLGQFCSTVDISTLPFTAGDSFQSRFQTGSTGGHWNKERTAVLEGGGDLLEYLLLQSTLVTDFSIDLGRIAAAKPYLNRYKFAGYIAEGVSPWEFIQANLLPLLPCSVAMGPGGVYVIPWKYDAIALDAVDRWDAGTDPTIEREGSVSYEGSRKDMINDFKLRYAISNRTGTSNGCVRLSAVRDASDPYSAENVFCRQSQARYGVRSEEQETTIVYDDATAGAILQWWSRAKSIPMRIVKYLVPQEKAWLERGNVVVLTDPELAFEETVCLIDSIVFREDDLLEITLRMIEDGTREFKRKG